MYKNKNNFWNWNFFEKCRIYGGFRTLKVPKVPFLYEENEMKISNLRVYGLENSIRVSKFPKSVDTTLCDERFTETAKKLGQAPRGSGHDNFLKGIIVQFDLTATNKMWVEAERYHWFELVSSQSTMHKIVSLDYDKTFCSFVSPVMIEEMKRLRDEYIRHPVADNYLRLLYNCPSGLQLTAGITTNYQQLKTIYYQRKDHRLPEWREFCQRIEELPYMDKFLK